MSRGEVNLWVIFSEGVFNGSYFANLPPEAARTCSIWPCCDIGSPTSSSLLIKASSLRKMRILTKTLAHAHRITAQRTHTHAHPALALKFSRRGYTNYLRCNFFDRCDSLRFSRANSTRLAREFHTQ